MKKLYINAFILNIFIILSITGSLFAQKNKIVVESWEKELNKRQPPEKIMDSIGLKPGMVIGDIGAGTGRYAVWFADRVAKLGKVYANDIDKDALKSLEKRCKNCNIKNIITVPGNVKNPLLPKKSLDIAFMINVYHHLDKPIPLVKNIIPSLKADGILAIVERDPEKRNGSSSHSTSKEVMKKQLSQAGFEIIRIETYLTEDNIYICRPKGRATNGN